MFKKFGIGMLAVVLAAAFSAFTLPQKRNTGIKTMDLHWYKVSNGVVSSTADYLGYKDQSALPSLCDQGTTNDCIRGFDQQLNFNNGPVSDRGIDQIQTDEQP